MGVARLWKVGSQSLTVIRGSPRIGTADWGLLAMNEQEVLDRAFAMPITNPAYARPPVRFVDRELVLITYRTDEQALRNVVPEPLKPASDQVLYEWIRMPDSSGLAATLRRAGHRSQAAVSEHSRVRSRRRFPGGVGGAASSADLAGADLERHLGFRRRPDPPDSCRGVDAGRCVELTR